MFRFEFVIVVVALVMTTSISGLNLADTECGVMNEGSRRYFQRILGGSVADITDFPYTISLKLDGKHFCGGSLVRIFKLVRFPTFDFNLLSLLNPADQ
jgi:hypothetical protein